MSESFGARLRQRRERQQIDLIAIAEQTKIKLSLLEALERDDMSHWPAGIFRRAFVRAYAHAIGLSPDVVLREFLEVHPDPIELEATAAAVALAAEAARMSAAPPTRLRHLVGSAIGSLSRLRRSPAADELFAGVGGLVNKPPSIAGDGVDAAYRFAASTDPAFPDDVHPPPGHDRVEPVKPAVARAVPVSEPAFEPDLLAAAQLCTEFGRVEQAHEVQPLLQEAARILEAIGLIVWVWDAQAAALWPALASGYSDRVLAQLPTVRRDGDNPTAAAFRLAQTCAINGSERSSGALAVPLLTPAGCAGVLAIELPHGSEQTRSVRAVATIFAAQLAQLIGGGRPQPDQAESAAMDRHDVDSQRELAPPPVPRSKRASTSQPSAEGPQTTPSSSAHTAVR